MNLRALLLAPLLLSLLGCTALGKIGQIIMDPDIPVGAPSDQPTEIALSLYASPMLNGNPRSHIALDPVATLEPSPYAVSLRAEDPNALADKLRALLDHLQQEFPAMSRMIGNTEATLARSPLLENAPGSYDAPDVQLTLPGEQAITPEQIATPIELKVLQLRDDSLLRNTVYPLLEQNPAKALRSTYVRDDDYLLAPGQFKFVPFEAIDPQTRFIAVIANYNGQSDAIWKQVLRIEPRGRKIALAVHVDANQILLKEES